MVGSKEEVRRNVLLVLSYEHRIDSLDMPFAGIVIVIAVVVVTTIVIAIAIVKVIAIAVMSC